MTFMTHTFATYPKTNNFGHPDHQAGPHNPFIAQVQPRPFFHPIIDVYTGRIIGYETLARGMPPYEMPQDIFGEAHRRGLEAEVEEACLQETLRAISNLPVNFRDLMFFINISPASFADLRFLKIFTPERLAAAGLDPGRIVLEVTEETSFENYDTFQKLASRYVAQGFKIALDDFGAGYSGLIALIACTPHYLKLDMAIVREVHLHAYKQKLVKSVASFASSVDTKLVAEGVESWEELEVLIRYGVRYIQGFLFGRPLPFPATITPLVQKKIGELTAKYDQAKIDLDRHIGDLVTRPPTLPAHTVACRELTALFHKNPKTDHVVLVNNDGSPTGLITRQHFYMKTGGAFGYDLFQKKKCDLVSKADPLIVEEKITITRLARLAMDRFPEDLYDPVLVVDERGVFIGTVTMKQVITKATELEVLSAMAANPLTNLPGNEIIRHWLQEALSNGEYALIYIDLDHFKGYNDSYGFLMGDELLRFTARVLSANLPILHEGAKLGHIGGDDFMIVCPGDVTPGSLDILCQAFDTGKKEYFKPEDLKKGYLDTFDRTGHRVQMPLVTMSLAVIDSHAVHLHPHPAHFAEAAASLKKHVKKMTAATGKSGYMFERRRWDEEEERKKYMVM